MLSLLIRTPSDTGNFHF